MTQQTFLRWAKDKGYRVGFADIGLLDFVKKKLERRKAEGEFAPGFFEENLDIFHSPDERALPRLKSILIVAVPAPAHILTFESDGKSVEAILPPTYVRYRPLFKQVRDEIRNEVLDGRPGIEILEAPLKSLAVVSGLSLYGRNNITYIAEIGSYYQLAGYVLDSPVEGDLFPAAVERKLELCRTCTACLKACPTGAIAEDRFLLHAERCYTLHSESPRPFPVNMNPPSPDCLLGCMKCQEVCPANKGRLKKVQAPVSFTAEETAALVRDGTIRNVRLDKSIESKIETLGLSERVSLYRRNLRRLLKIRSRI